MSTRRRAGKFSRKVLEIAQVDGIALQAFHRLGEVHAPQGGGDDILDVPHREAIAGGLTPVDVEIEIIAPGNPLRKGAGGFGNAL